MKLNEIVSACYCGCNFPARYNKRAIEYYREHSYGTRCLFLLERMMELNNYTLCSDDLRFMCQEAPEVWPELLEAFIYAAYEDIKQNKIKPRNLDISLDD